jgi:hypothetical protein
MIRLILNLYYQFLADKCMTKACEIKEQWAVPGSSPRLYGMAMQWEEMAVAYSRKISR